MPRADNALHSLWDVIDRAQEVPAAIPAPSFAADRSSRPDVNECRDSNRPDDDSAHHSSGHEFSDSPSRPDRTELPPLPPRASKSSPPTRLNQALSASGLHFRPLREKPSRSRRGYWGWVVFLSAVLHIALLFVMAWMLMPAKQDFSFEIDTAFSEEQPASKEMMDSFAIEIPDAGLPEKMDIRNFVDNTLTASLDDPDAISPDNNLIPRRGGRQLFSGGGAGGLGGAPGELFGDTNGAKSIVFVIDRSSSMRGRRLSVVKRELAETVSRLQPAQIFNVIFYSDSNHFLGATSTRGHLPAKFVRSHMMQRLRHIQADGATRGEAAMLAAAQMRPELIVFLTDGQFSLSTRRVLRRVHKNTRVNVIVIGAHTEMLELREIADKTGGQFRMLADAE